MMKLRLALVLLALGAALQVIEAGPASAACHVITFEGDPYTVGEGSGKVTITVSNNGGQGTNQTVDYETINGTAQAPGDYASASGTLTFPGPPGDVSFNVTIKDDPTDEPAERFTVRLSDPGGICPGATIAEETATVTIIDNDTKPQASPAATSTGANSPKPKASTPTATRTPTVTGTPTQTTTPTPSPTDTKAPSPIAQPDDAGGGLSGGALAGIVAGVVVLGGAGALLVRRRFLA